MKKIIMCALLVAVSTSASAMLGIHCGGAKMFGEAKTDNEKAFVACYTKNYACPDSLDKDNSSEASKKIFACQDAACDACKNEASAVENERGNGKGMRMKAVPVGKMLKRK